MYIFIKCLAGNRIKSYLVLVLNYYIYSYNNVDTPIFKFFQFFKLISVLVNIYYYYYSTRCYLFTLLISNNFSEDMVLKLSYNIAEMCTILLP